MVVALVALFVALTGTAIGKNQAQVGKLPPNSVGSAQIKPNAVKTSEIATNAVKPGQVASGAIGPKALQTGAVTSTALAPLAVTAPAIAPGSVGTPAIKPGAVEKTKLADGAVGTSQLENSAITAAKIGSRAVIESKIDVKSVGTEQLSNAIPSAAASMASDTSIPATGGPLCITFVGCFTGLEFATEVFDSAGMHDPSSGRYLKAPVDGVYQVTATVSWANDGCEGIRGIIVDGLRTDGTTRFLPSDGIWKADNAVAGISTDQVVTGMVQLTAGESVGVIAIADPNMVCTDTSISQGRSTLAMNWLAPGP